MPDVMMTVQLKEKATESRASKTSGEGPDDTRYDLRIGETLHAAQWKRRMIFLVVRAAIALGTKRAHLPLPARKWLVVDGHTSTREAFVDLVRTKIGPDNSLDERRWFLNDDELFRDATSTFALSNQWSGAEVLPIIDEIAERHPQLGISYEAKSSIG